MHTNLRSLLTINSVKLFIDTCTVGIMFDSVRSLGYCSNSFILLVDGFIPVFSDRQQSMEAGKDQSTGLVCVRKNTTR